MKTLRKILGGVLALAALGVAARVFAAEPRPPSAESTGRLLVTVKTPRDQPLPGITVYVLDAAGRVDSCLSDPRGEARFDRVKAGRILVRTADKSGTRRAHGAFISLRTDTARVRAARITRIAVVTAQRSPPALYR